MMGQFMEGDQWLAFVDGSIEQAVIKHEEFYCGGSVDWGTSIGTMRNLNLRRIGCLLLGSISILLVACHPPFGDKVAPIVKIKTTGVLEAQYLKEDATWFHDRIAMPQFQSWGSQPWANEARAFCEKALVADLEDKTTLTDLVPVADKLMATGCNDPLVCYLAFKVHPNWRDGEPALNRALENMSSGSVKAMLAVTIATAKVKLEDALGFFSPEFSLKSAEAFKKSLGDGSFDSSDVHALVRAYFRAFRDTKTAKAEVYAVLKEACAASPLPEWARLTLDGAVEANLAWVSRGNGLAVEVTDNGWQGFMKHLKLAQTDLERAWSLHPEAPEAAATLITVHMGLGTGVDELVKWFERATTANLDCSRAYRNLSYALEPRWGGSPQLMLSLGLACAETKRYDTEVPAVLWSVCDYITNGLGNSGWVYSNPAVRAATLDLQAGYLADKTGPDSTRRRHASMAAVAAHFMGEVAKVDEALAAAGSALAPEGAKFLHSAGLGEARMRLEHRAAKGDFGPELVGLPVAAEHYRHGELDRVLKSIPTDKLKPEAQGYVEAMRFLAGFEDKFNKGDWVPVPVDPALCLFSQSGGSCHANDKGELVFEGNDQKTFSEVVFRARIAGDCEIRGEFDADISPKIKMRRMPIFGPVIGCELGGFPNVNPPMTRGVVLVSSIASPVDGQICGAKFLNRRPRPSIPFAQTNRFHLGVFGGKATFDLNGAPYATREDLSSIEVMNTSGMAGFCVQNIPLGCKVTVRHLEIRKATASALDVMK